MGRNLQPELLAAANQYAAQTGYLSPEEIFARADANIVRLPTGYERVKRRNLRNHPLFFAATKDC